MIFPARQGEGEGEDREERFAGDLDSDLAHIRDGGLLREPRGEILPAWRALCARISIEPT